MNMSSNLEIFLGATSHTSKRLLREFCAMFAGISDFDGGDIRKFEHCSILPHVEQHFHVSGWSEIHVHFENMVFFQTRRKACVR